MKENIGFFEKNGYFIIEDAFTLEECNKLTELSHKHVKNSELIPIMNIHNYSKEILLSMSNKKIINFIENYFSGNAKGLQTEFFFMPPKTKGFTPHQDNTFVQAKDKTFISAWIALTDVNENNGGLIIWPGTHKEENLLTVKNIDEKNKNQDPNARIKSTLIPEKYESKTPLIKKGSVMIIHSWLVHASNDNLSDNNRYALLCTYIKKGAAFRAGNYAKRKSFNLIVHE
jgi:phytanoyl-CoA hydroxylase|tara:strand:- start:364 stop:1050 length:687 start_codon:yes stop_codon:yes gene_type:complete